MTVAYKDPAHRGNKIRPCVRCHGCGKLGCVTAWGDWCFECNVRRLDRINTHLGIRTPEPPEGEK